MMLTTSEFAKLCSTTKKTIIYYDSIELLTPTKKEGTYRYYSPNQVLQFQQIDLLKNLGFSLTQIQEILSSKKTETFLKEQKDNLEKERQKLLNKIHQVDKFLENFKNDKNYLSPKIKKVPSYSILGFYKQGKYIDIPKYFDELKKIIDDQEEKYKYLIVYYDDKFSPLNANMFLAVVYEESLKKYKDKLEVVKVPDHKCVYSRHIGEYDHLSFIWQTLDDYVKKEGYKENKQVPCREIYLLKNPRNKNIHTNITELQIAIK